MSALLSRKEGISIGSKGRIAAAVFALSNLRDPKGRKGSPGQHPYKALRKGSAQGLSRESYAMGGLASQTNLANNLRVGVKGL
jgi:hypothetical protein